eukprot:6202023-Pleurochrysis_carterae.AAC.3
MSGPKVYPLRMLGQLHFRLISSWSQPAGLMHKDCDRAANSEHRTVHILVVVCCSLHQPACSLLGSIGFGDRVSCTLPRAGCKP